MSTYSVSENNERSNAVLFFGKKTSLNITAFGDSLTAGATSEGNPYTKFLKKELENYGSTAQVFNSGVGGETSVTIAARQGGNPFIVRVTGGVIPATTSPVVVTLDNINGQPVRPMLQGTAYWDGKLGDIDGRLSIVKPNGGSTWDEANYYTFTRKTAGSQITANQPLTFYTNFGEEHRGDIQIIWAGQNGPTNTRSIEDVKAMVQHLTGLNKKYLVISKPSSTDAQDAEWSAAFGPRFISIRKYMSEFGLKEAGISPTEQDLVDIAQGKVPTSLRNDSVHWKAEANEVMGKYIFNILKELGWI